MEPEIIKEALRWVYENKQTDGAVPNYTSPRLSSEMMDCSMPMTFDSLNRCFYGCLYCFAYFQKAYKNELTGKVYPLAKVNLAKLTNIMDGLSRNKNGDPFYDHFFKKRFLLHWGGMADPFCGFEKKIGVTQKLLTMLGEKAYPTLLSFKGDTIFDEDYLRIFDNYAGQSNFAFQVSIITADDDMAKKVEVGVPSPTRRLEALKVLSDMGYWTILRLRPFIIGITDKTLDELLEKALAAGIKAISTEFFAIDHRCTAGTSQRYKWLGDLVGTDNLLKYYTTLSPSARGGYCRLNRNVKEAHIRKIYTFCQKHGLVLGVSDPDFKELCTSGSCCAMPDTFKQNPEMCNWSTDQLTYHVKRARQLYHTTGEKSVITFDDVFNSESSTYLGDSRLGNDYVGVIGRNSAERKIFTPKLILQEQWNNLRSGNCPRNYLDGKLTPIGLDNAGNYTFQYNPMEYEQRWVQQGVDLTF